MLVFFGLIGCGKSESTQYVMNGVELVAEGPLFEGSNTVQGTAIINLNDLANGISADNLKEVKLTSITLYSNDSIPFDGMKSVTLSITANDAGMQQGAVLNPIVVEGNKIQLNVAQDADFTELFKQKEIIIVADADLNADRESNLTLSADLEFKVEYKK